MSIMDWLPSGSDTPPADRRNEQRLTLWMFVFVAGALLVTGAIATGWLQSGTPTILAIALAALVGLATIGSYRRWLREMEDELRRKIELDSLALAAGAGLVGGWTLELLAYAGFIAHIGFEEIIMVMTIAYLAGRVFGYWRYR